MLHWLEQISEANQHAVAALGAISTFAAVVVSLVLASIVQRSSRTRIKALATISVIFHPSLKGRPKPEYVTVAITNVGLMPVMIPLAFLHLKVPFRSGYWMITPWDYVQHDPWVPMRTYPVEIRPRGSATITLSEIERFRSTTAEMFQQVSRWRWRFRFIKALVVTEDGKIFKVKLDKTIRRELAKVRRTAKALEHV